MSRVETKGLRWSQGKGERRQGGEKFDRTEKQSERREVETPYGIASGEDDQDD